LSRVVKIGSRGSDLALWQANFFQGQLDSIGVQSEIIIIKTKGDRIQHLSFDKIEGKGFFTKEIEDQLLNGDIDIAIHSHKDLETQSPEGLTIAGVSYRENPAELLLTRKECVDMSLPLQFKADAIIGTSSARRKAQVTALRPDITIKDIRGNVPTRINKLRSGDFDAILLAAAGVSRLNLDVSDLHVQTLDTTLFIPAPAQGVLAYQTRETDQELIDVIQELHDQDVKNAIDIERGILSGFGGGCHIPIGVHATPNNEGFTVRATFAKEWETFSKRVRFQAKDKAEALQVFTSVKDKPYPKSFFISRPLENESFIKRGCEAHNVSLTSESLIQTKAVSAKLPKDDYHWLFFASSNAVEFYFEQFGVESVKNKKIGVYGIGTATALGNFVEQIDFIGSEGAPEQVATGFAEIVDDNAIVLFPCSNISNRSIQKALVSESVINLVVYNTQENTTLINDHEAYCFTSPSNVRAFFNGKNSFPVGAKVIAIGPKTGAELTANGVSAFIADQPHEAEIFTLLA
jgi:hydroxymethylbilane synthase